ncbi:tetratricopeptide repeat protein [Paenibacillus sp. Marseille-Q7038]
MNADDYIQEAYKAIFHNDFERAVYWFETAIAEEPNNPEIHYRCSITYARNGKLDQAFVHANKAAEMAPGHIEYLIHINRLQSKKLTAMSRVLIESGNADPKKNYEKALEQLKQAITLDPLYTEAYVWLAVAYAEMNDYILAIAVLKEAIAMEPQNEQLTDLLYDFNKRMRIYFQKPST